MNPRFIAICGHPTSGKSTAQTILHNVLGYVPVDDGRPLRVMAKNWFGLSERQVTTQEGKQETVRLNGKDWVVRDILGSIGDGLEDKFGPEIIPLMTMHHYGMVKELSKSGYSFGSVRKQQGHFYRRHGGMVIEVTRPGVAASPYAFDAYDPTAIDVTVVNDGSLELLEERLCAAIRLWAAAYASPND